MNPTLKTWHKLAALPGGKAVFSRGVCLKAPYFATISPRFEELAIGRAVVRMKERRRVHNHLSSIHAIALCNLAEAAAGLTAEVSMPAGMRWIPAGMTVRYLGKAKGTVRAIATMRDIDPGEKADVPVSVSVRNGADEIVFEAEITMYVSPKKA
ncbi:DUF4442 domain-containing protein [Spongiibacter nanhainus]|uniref:DUF4442 domain-containing protein n=1 Tax=Spongiibacter nanhainus TaxID=2794344 RepID=A0A7T4R1N6_9GAMM|nr:hotdog fold domain-containing protein [Spongiibacter nanhainus]QQD18826.1 DUF4442 domain-containing protein [Spongiibacter nanhainus]